MNKKVCFIVFFLLLIASAALAADDDNLCYTTYAGACNSDIEWEIGWFWANHEANLDNCSTYQQFYGNSVGDIWGMCAQHQPAAQGAEAETETESEAQAEYIFFLTSQDHPWHGEGSNPCPVEGLDPIINYEENTFVCGTGF